jgi:hypothetical protein
LAAENRYFRGAKRRRLGTKLSPDKSRRHTIKSQRTDCLKAIRKDFLKLQKAAKKEGWTRDTPVPLGFFGE